MLFEPISEIIAAYWVFLAAALVIGVATGWSVSARASGAGSGRQDADRRR